MGDFFMTCPCKFEVNLEKTNHDKITTILTSCSQLVVHALVISGRFSHAMDEEADIAPEEIKEIKNTE